MQALVTGQPCAFEAEAPIAGKRLHEPGGGMPVEVNEPFALAALDQEAQALHRHEEFQALHPLDFDAQRVVVAQIIELGGIFAFGRGNAQRRRGFITVSSRLGFSDASPSARPRDSS